MGIHLRRIAASAFACATLAVAWAAAAATPPVKLSACALDATRSLTIGPAAGQCGPSVLADRPFTGAAGLGTITVAAGGTLTLPDQAGLRIDTAGIVLAGGTLRAGSSTQPVAGPVTLNFTGSQPAGTPTGAFTKGIAVLQGGSLQLYGKYGVAGRPGAASWTHLAAPAGPPALYGPNLGVGAPVGTNGATTLQLAGNVDWQPGQWIVVAGTDYSPDSAEFVRIHKVRCAQGGGCTVQLDPATPLRNYHYGGPAPGKGQAGFAQGPAHNYGVDERAEVGLVSRGIRLTASDTVHMDSTVKVVPSASGSGTTTVTVTVNNAWGGEIMAMGGFRRVALQGVELENFGKAQLGSYPIHFHRAGTAAAGQVLVDSNSIHHSYNKCVTLHSTSGVTVSNNVCARAVGHLFYMEAGDETGNAFIGNLGIGAMSSRFGIAASNTAARAAFWAGDYLARGAGATRGNGYDGLLVPFTDNSGSDPPPVQGNATVSSGFWITNPANTFSGNSVAGCQDFGRGYWLLPASLGAATGTLTFAGNRAHGCYTGVDTASDDGVTGAVLYTPQGACPAASGKSASSACDLVARLDDVTATRNRNRGIWVRASWYALRGARLATNRDGVSLVSSGGSEGSPPGEWGLLRDAVVVGMSTNNVLRFGPCPYAGQNGFGGNAGCYDVVHGNGYPSPSWNFAGMMFYDGPARLEHVRFVNFRKDIRNLLTTADLTYFDNYAPTNTIPCQSRSFVYEGDAAMGWFQSNENSYPPTQYVEKLRFDNVDLRHQVYTQNVQLTCAPTTPATGNFRDGDKFTVILDRDGSLTGYSTVAAGTQTTGLTPLPGAAPISLNNLPFLAGPDTADECLSTGAQDALLEQRPTSLISPYSYATLEFSALTGCNGVSSGGANCVNDNIMLFAKDQKDYGGATQFTDSVTDVNNNFLTFNCGGKADTTSAGVPGHACVALSGRNGNGVYEPKLVHGLGYTVGASKGMPAFVSLMYGDAHLPGGISPATPFRTRVGICYRNKGQAAPKLADITVKKGAKAFAAPNGNAATLQPGLFNPLACTGLDNVMCGSNPDNAACYTSLCPSAPAASTPGGQGGTVTVLPSVASIAALADPAQCPGGDCFFYDEGSGMLFLNVQQKQPNAGGPATSPLGSCSGTAGGDCAPVTFYSCPAGGCELYTVSVGGSYAPTEPSDCTPYGGSPDYSQPYPAGMNRLAYAASGTAVATTLVAGVPAYPHQAPSNAPAGFCPVNVPAKPDWPASPGAQAVFSLAAPSAATQAAVIGAPVTPGTPLLQLTPGQTYTLTATQTGIVGATCAYATCEQRFTVLADGSGFSSSGANCCGLGTGTFKLNALQPQAGPYACRSATVPGSTTACFQVNLPPAVQASLLQGTATVPILDTMTPPVAALTPGASYTLSASASSSSCTQTFTVNGSGQSGFSSASNCCGIGTSGSTNALNVGAAPWPACTAPSPSGGNTGTGSFTFGLPGGVQASIVQGTATVPTTPAPFALAPGNYTLNASAAAASGCTTGNCACSQAFTVGTGNTVSLPSGSTCCGLQPNGTSPITLSIGAPPWACTGGGSSSSSGGGTPP